MFVVTSNQMYQAECSAVKRGMTFPQLMENAGTACAKIIKKRFCITRENPRRVLVICGKGRLRHSAKNVGIRLQSHGYARVRRAESKRRRRYVFAR